MGNTPGHNKDVSVSAKQMQDSGVKSGFLTKVGQSVKSWKKRYFIFDGDTLYYFENMNSLRQKGEIKVEDILCVVRADTEIDKPFALTVETPHRNYFVIANTEQDIEEWRMVLSGDIHRIIEAIEELCTQVNTELIGTNDDQLEHKIGELQDMVTEKRNSLYSCAKGKTCANKADQLITQAISALQQRRRVFYAPTVVMLYINELSLWNNTLKTWPQDILELKSFELQVAMSTVVGLLLYLYAHFTK